MFNIYELSRLLFIMWPTAAQDVVMGPGDSLATVRMRDLALHGIGHKMHF